MLYYALQHPSTTADDLAVMALNLLMLAIAACGSSALEQVRHCNLGKRCIRACCRGIRRPSLHADVEVLLPQHCCA